MMTKTAAAKTRPRLTRAEKASRTRQSLLEAAAKILGEGGSGEVSVASITREANVALGTFYMHFSSKQELLDELLPWVGQMVRSQLNDAVAGAENYADYELRNFDELMLFQQQHPYFVRLLSECEVVTPGAYQYHIDKSLERYRSALQQAWDRGELKPYKAEDLDLLAVMLVSIKLLLFMRYGSSEPKTVAHMRRVYLTFVFQALFGDGAAKVLPKI
jgi:AcrR family transcriptional regulator